MGMKFKRVVVRRKFNLGNYQTLDFELEATLQPNENPKEALLKTEQIILEAYQGRPSMVIAQKIGVKEK